MTREEEIIEAARERADRHQIAEMELYSGDKCNYSYGRIYNAEIASFEAGAKWAEEHLNLSSPWHQASEEPVGRGWRIICEDEEGKYWIKDWADVIQIHYIWNEYVKAEMIVKWAYVDELIKE